MKTTLCLVAVMAFSFTAIAVAVDTETRDGSAVSVLETSSIQPNSTVQDEVVPPVPVAQDPVAPVADGGTIIEGPAGASSGCCNSCCVPCCRCCPPPPVAVTYCLEDPCCCKHEAEVCVPACCAGEAPCVTWRKGLFGRQIATLCWKCCDHKVKVIIRRCGKVKVRD